MAATKLKIKLVIDASRGRRVVYAEAGKDFADFLFSILTLPLSTVIRLLGKEEMVGSLPNLYQSIETLNKSFIRPNVNKDTLLSPVPPLSGYNVPIFSLKEPPAPVKRFYSCFCRLPYGTCDVSDYYGASCKSCHNTMNKQLNYVAPLNVLQKFWEGGFVKESVTYMVMDDLGVKPMCSTSAITSLLKEFNVKDVCALEEKEVEIGNSEAVKLLKASFVTKMVLTSVFLDVNTKKELA